MAQLLTLIQYVYAMRAFWSLDVGFHSGCTIMTITYHSVSFIWVASICTMVSENEIFRKHTSCDNNCKAAMAAQNLAVQRY